MPAVPQTPDQLTRLIERSGLVSLEAIRERLNGRQQPAGLLPFAKWLIQSGLLTKFQVDQLLQGKSRGFFLGNYRVLELIGGGATAGVFLCEHRVMRHRAAVKVLSQDLVSQDEKNLARFRREAQAAAALDHPHIVRTIDLDEDEGRHFLVMEYVEGVTLDKWMAQNTNAPPRVYVHFILQAALGLQHIHRAGLIHRDMKPSNLLLDKEGIVKILDLGLAKFTDGRNDGLSQLQGSNIMGTVDFMSPEQADGSRDLDIRGDIYSLGATLYYLLTGQIPFPANTLGAKMIAIQFQQPQPIREFRPDIDPLLEKIVARMMAKDPAKRFQTPDEVVAVFQGWLNRSSRRLQAAKDGPPSIRSKRVQAVPVAQPAEPVVEAASLRPRRWLKWTVRATALLAIVGALAIIKPWNLGHKASAQAAPTANK